MTNSQHNNSQSGAFLRSLRYLATATVLAVGLSAPAATPASAAAAIYPQIFGSTELHSDNLTRFTKWTSVIRRSFSELQKCKTTSCDDDGWGEFLASVRGRGDVDQLRAVNSWINRVTYISDADNRGTADYWETPLEFLSAGGDCEDYAIAKYMALRELGVPAENMRLVVLQHLQRGIPHAVLIVYAEGRPYLLDNLLSGVQLADTSLPYRPVYSVNETGWWLHVSPKNNKSNWTQTASNASADSQTEAGAIPEQRRTSLK